MRAICLPRARSRSTQIAVPSASIGRRMTAIQKERSPRRAAPRWTIASTAPGSATALA